VKTVGFEPSDRMYRSPVLESRGLAQASPASGETQSLVVPTTRTDFSNALHVEINPPEGGLREKSFAMPEQLRALSHERVSKRLGRVRPATVAEPCGGAGSCYVIRSSTPRFMH
jgi:mRNA-degrading endonuclease toxin of MazEF toxin-antitoxin module